MQMEILPHKVNRCRKILTGINQSTVKVKYYTSIKMEADIKPVKLPSLITLTFLFTAIPVLANQKTTDEKVTGEKLLRQLWNNIEKLDMDMIEKTVAGGFQSVHQFGANNREQEIELIRNLKLGKYNLSNIKITRNGPVIIATYFVSV